MNKNVKLFGVMVLAGFIGGCVMDGSDVETLSDSAKTQINTDALVLDKALVPALFYSNLGTQPDGVTVLVPSAESLGASRLAAGRLVTSWDGFQVAHQMDLGVANWNGYFVSINASITLANTTYANANGPGSNVSPAHHALEDARNVMVRMRAENGITYLMDVVTETHHRMEPVGGAVTVYNASSKDAAAQAQLISSVTQPLASFQVEWQIMNANLASLAAEFGMSSEKTQYLTTTAGQMSGAINAANSALSAGNAATLATELAKIKPTFVKMFLTFGDFITPFRTQMVAMERAYAAVLYCSNNPLDAATTCGGTTGTNSYLLSFENTWNAFKGNYPVLPPSTNTPVALNWKTDMDKVSASIATAKPVMAGAASMTDLTVAHNALEEVRIALYHLRHTYENYDFVVDYLTAYHNVFEPVVLTVVDANKQPKQVLSTEEKATIVAGLPQIRAAFNTLKTKVSAMNAAEFGLNAQGLANMLAAQESNLTALEAAMASGSGKTDAEIATLALNIKKLFVPLFKAFGKF